MLLIIWVYYFDYSCRAINFFIALTHAINYFNHALKHLLTHQSDSCGLQPANDYVSHLQDATTVELVLLACQLKVVAVVAALL